MIWCFTLSFIVACFSAWCPAQAQIPDSIRVKQIERQVQSNSKDVAVEFMLKEYERFSNLTLEEYRRSEQVVNFYLTIVTGLIGVILIISQLKGIQKRHFFYITLTVLGIALLYGISVQNRLITGAVRVKAHTKIISRIENYFAKNDPQIVEFLEYKDKVLSPIESNNRFRHLFLRLIRGGLNNLPVLTNSFLLAGIIFTILFYRKNSINSIALGWTLFAFLVSLLIFAVYTVLMRTIQIPS